MPLEINEGRTPPSVMFTMSRSTSVLETDRNSPRDKIRPKAIKCTEQFKDVSNLKVHQRRSRSFTPVKDSLYLRSPELSPIDAPNNKQRTPEIFPSNPSDMSVLEQSLTPGDYNLEKSLTPIQFKVPPPLYKLNQGTTPTSTSDHVYRRGGKEVKNEDLNQTHNLDKSSSHGYLNHKLEVRLILMNAGMQQYIEAFDNEKIDFGKFLSLCEEDLSRLGVERKVDRKVIFNIITDLNAN